MTGMEQMMLSLLQKMTGLTPEQMQQLSENAIKLLLSLDTRLANIEKKLDINSPDSAQYIEHNSDTIKKEETDG